MSGCRRRFTAAAVVALGLLCAGTARAGTAHAGTAHAGTAHAGTADAGTVTPAGLSGPPLLGGPHVTGAGGKFAGFTQKASVSSISADWRVPAIAARSRSGSASTWIGADAYGRAIPAPFLQIGTTEEAVSPLPDSPPEIYYEAFWSDTAHSYEPLNLFAIGAGDRISASMTLLDRRWRLTVRDLTSGRGRSFSVVQEGGRPFTRALWLQEDVSDAYTDAALPYPDLGSATLSALSLNHGPLSYRALISEWIGLPGGYLAPTALRDDAFSVTPRRLTSAGAEYLRIVAPEDAAANAYISALDAWTASTPVATIEAETARFVPVLARADARLGAAHWPAAAAHQIQLLVRNGNYQTSHLPAAAQQGAAAVTAVVDQANQLSPADSGQIRRELGVQEYA